MLIHFGGIDGSGKSLTHRHVLASLAQAGKRTFDAVAYHKEQKRPPLPEDVGDAEIIATGEPTHSWIGAAIRHEFIRNGTNYSPYTIGEAYSLDRLLQYNRLILPLLADGKMVISDRSVETSLVYQPLQNPELTVEHLLSLTGNALAIKHRPDLLIIFDCPPEIASSRLGGRGDKNDDSIFEKLDFLKKAHAAYRSDWFKAIWEKAGTKLVYLNADQTPAEVQREALELVRSFAKI